MLAALEGGLRLAGFGYSTHFFAPVAGSHNLTVNEAFARQFYAGPGAIGKSHPFLIPAKKSSNTFRIFILGESAALGTPEPSFGFGRILEEMLRRQYPEHPVEVVNAAMRGINSHIILPIARECARHQPDLFIVYAGNNEVIGLHAPGPNSGFLDQHLPLIRALHWLKSLKTAQLLLAPFEKNKAKPPEQDMEFFRARRLAFQDPRRQRVYEHFRANLQDICQAASRAGAKTLLCTVPVNWRDFPPLGSLHRPGLAGSELSQWEDAYAKGVAAETTNKIDAALEHFRTALRLDDQFAELHFRLARCYESSGKTPEARRHFALACDTDALSFRADSRVNGAIRDLAARRAPAGLSLIDAERAFAENGAATGQIPGGELFHEHVHLKFDGDYLLARTLYPTVVAAMGKTCPAELRLPTRQECAETLAFTAWDELQIETSMVAGLAHPPYLDQLDHAQRQLRAEQASKDRRAQFGPAEAQKARSIYEKAIAQRPGDWQLHHNYGKFCYLTGDFTKAAEHLAFEVPLFPNRASSRMGLGMALRRAGREQEAMAEFNEVLHLDPNNESARKALASIPLRPGRPP